MMRHYLSPELRHRFDIAWNMLPGDVRGQLKPLIFDVREVSTLEGIRIMFDDGKGAISQSDGYGWCAFDEKHRKFYVGLKASLVNEVREAGAVYTILHEFVDGIDYLQDGSFAESRSEVQSEAAACAQVIA